MSISGNDMVNLLGNISPETLSEDWDNSGVQIDLGNDTIGKVLVALEINNAVIDEAIKSNIDMIITHHPLIFSSMKKIRRADILGNKLLRLIENKISVYSMHTSFDSVKGGNNDYILDLMKWESNEILVNNSKSYYKIVVFVPSENLEEVKTSLCSNGAGQIGDYKDCTFYSEGTGTFTPIGNAKPHIGLIDKKEKVKESKLESIVAEENLYAATNAMINAHPYEEPAYDVIKLENKINKEGLGRIVSLNQESTTLEILKELKTVLNINEEIKYASEGRSISRVGVCTGSGADLIKTAKAKGCDLLITGDIKYHDAHMAKELNIDLIDIEHFHSEKIFTTNLINKLEKELDDKVIIEESKVNLNPFIKK